MSARSEFWKMVSTVDPMERAQLAHEWEADWVEEAHYMYATVTHPEVYAKTHEYRREAALRALGEEVAKKCAKAWDTKHRFDTVEDGFTLTVVLPKRRREMDL